MLVVTYMSALCSCLGNLLFVGIEFGFFPLLLSELFFLFEGISKVGYCEILFFKEGSV